MIGKVKSYVAHRNFGFIQISEADAPDLFFHINQCADADYFPRRGDRVSFTLAKDRQDRPTAKNVKLITEAPKAADVQTVERSDTPPAPRDWAKDLA